LTQQVQTSDEAVEGRGAHGECFTIMPFGGWNDEYYSTIYSPAIEAADLIPRRVDDLYRPSAIVHDIWTYTQRCRIVLADLTGKNPNVFYELGLAHAIAKPAVLVAESISDVPFDLRALRVIDYDKNEPNWGQTLQSKIETAIREVLASPLQSVLPSFLEVTKADLPPITEYQKLMIEIRQEVELLRQEMRRFAEGDVRTEPRAPSVSASESRVPSIGQWEARERIAWYISRGMSPPEIASRLARRGVPQAWTENVMKDMASLMRVGDRAVREDASGPTTELNARSSDSPGVP
jgi:hypothetical protein